MTTSPHDATREQLQASEGEDAEKLKREVDRLVSFGWKIDSDKMGLEASFSFSTFGKAADFITAVNIQSKIRNHHAETYNMYKMVYLHWTTHKPRGLSAKDTDMAQWCHEQATALEGRYNADVSSWRAGCMGCENPNM